MSGLRSIVFLSLMSVAITVPRAHAADNGEEAHWEVVTIGASKIAVPRGWRNFDKTRPNMPLSFSLDERKFDAVKVRAAYEDRDSR